KTADHDVLVFTATDLKSPKARRLQKAGVELVSAKTRRGRIDLLAVLEELGRRDILGVLLEAGPVLNGAALAAGIVQKLVLFFAPKLAGDSRVPLTAEAPLDLAPLRIVSTAQFGPDFAVELRFRNPRPDGHD